MTSMYWNRLENMQARFKVLWCIAFTHIKMWYGKVSLIVLNVLSTLMDLKFLMDMHFFFIAVPQHTDGSHNLC